MSQLPLIDTYPDSQASGQTLGTPSSSGELRQGIDQEGGISIDQDALRIAFLEQPGWGRAGIAYGPYDRQPGLTLGVLLLNGHNNSKTGDIMQSFLRRVARWILGNGTLSPWQQLVGLLRSPYKARMLKRLRYWFDHAPKRFRGPVIQESLAVGWFPHSVPVDPRREGHGLMVRALRPQNGAIQLRVAEAWQSAVEDAQNLQIYYVIVLRQIGAAYYIASVPNAKAMAAYPEIRPLGIDPTGQDKSLYAGIYQSVLGQIGFSMDTRIYSTQVDLVSQWSNWYGTAHRADLLQGEGSLAGSAGELEGTWNVIQGSYGRTGMGTFAQADQNLALMASDIPCGLVHVQVITSAAIAPIALLWRVQDSDNFWSFAIDHQGSQLKIKENGLWQTVAVQEQVYLSPDTSHSLQILDDGQTFQLSCNGQRAFCFTDPRLQDQAGLGLFTSQAHPQQHFYGFEAHPRQVLLPPALRLKAPWGLNLLNRQTSPDITEDFGGASQELTGKSSTTGGQIWHKLMGKGAIRLTGEGSARVHGSWQQPHEGRTAYGVDWYHPEFADVQVQITPPELYQGQKTEGRGGLIFWQDRDNFLAISTWVSNIHPGSAVSCFFCFAGYEDLYSAVWTDTGDRILWGVPHLFRVCFDGMNYQGFVNDEPVIYRALTDVFPQIEPLIIRRVGIVANWEWGGGDMGSRFDHFRAQPY